MSSLQNVPSPQSPEQYPTWGSFAEFVTWCRVKLSECAPLIETPSLEEAKKLSLVVASLLKDPSEGVAQLDNGPYDCKFQDYTDFDRSDLPLIVWFTRNQYYNAMELSKDSPEERRLRGLEELVSLFVVVGIFNRTQQFLTEYDSGSLQNEEFKQLQSCHFRAESSGFFNAYLLRGIIMLNSMGLQAEVLELTNALSGAGGVGAFDFGIGGEQTAGLEALKAPKPA
jgi:hypothetical protein